MRSQHPSRALSKHPRIVRQLWWIEENWPAIGQVAVMPKRLVESLDEFGEREENRDLRGTRVKTINLTKRTLKHVKSAVKRVGGEDRSIARNARQFLKSLQHIRDFDVTVEKARAFFGKVLKEGRRNANKKAVCEPEEHVFSELRGVGRLRLRRVVSVAELRKVGRKLDLCVAHASEVGRPYHAELRSRETEFWTLGTESDLVGLLSVEDDDGLRRVTEFQGQNGNRPVVTDHDERSRHLPGWVLRNILRRLDADADDQQYFTCEGAFRSLLPRAARKNCRDILADGRYFRVWRFPGEMIVASTEKPPKGVMPGRGAQWSRFVRRPLRQQSRRATTQSAMRYKWLDGAWHNEAMDIGDLLGLLQQSPEIYDAFAGRE